MQLPLEALIAESKRSDVGFPRKRGSSLIHSGGEETTIEK
jgi:hypothetical protein